MADKVFLIKYEELESKGILPHTLYNLPIPDLEKLATRVLTPKEAVERFNDNRINTEVYFTVYREVGDVEIHVEMGADDWQEIIVNKDLQIHIATKDEGYSIDLYAWNEDTPDDERDYDSEFISSCWASFAELEEARGSEDNE